MALLAIAIICLAGLGFIIREVAREKRAESILKRILPVLILAILSIQAHAQQSNTSCTGHTPASPCMQLNWTNSSMAATVTNNSSGLETSGPGTATVWKCVGSTSSCPAASLGNAPWVALIPVAQTTPAGIYADWSIAYSQTVNYAVTNTWTGGGTSGYSSVLTFQIPQAPQTAPLTPSAPAGTFVN